MAKTLPKCQEHCKKVDGAKYFSFTVEQGCFCKDIDALDGWGPMDNIISGELNADFCDTLGIKGTKQKIEALHNHIVEKDSNKNVERKKRSRTCLEHDVDYNGSDVGKPMEKNSLIKCQKYCKNVNGARFFHMEWLWKEKVAFVKVRMKAGQRWKI
eukprot:UN25098